MKAIEVSRDKAGFLWFECHSCKRKIREDEPWCCPFAERMFEQYVFLHLKEAA